MPQNFSHESPNQTYNIPSGYGDVLLHWQAREHEPLKLGPRSQTIVTVLLVAIVGYAIYTNSPLMAITFILIGIIGYLQLHREPRVVSFLITTRGIIADNKLYEYDTLESFFIYTDPPFENILSIQTNGELVPYVHIPIGEVDVNVLRDTLDEFVPEEKHRPRLVDTLEKLLHL
jgi:hypothetical protein